jgi:thioredoxin-like negative regulator of GroEL
VRPRSSVLIATAALAGTLACATRAPIPLPQGEDYVFPAPAPRELADPEEKVLREAWADILAGDAARAERRLARLRRPGTPRPSVDAATGYARMRAGRFPDAASSFAAALGAAPSSVPALVGAGCVAARRGDDESALSFYRRAQATAPEDALVRQRVASLKLAVTEKRMARAQAAVDAGDAAGAEAGYRAVLEVAPEVAPVRLALAERLAARGEARAAADLLAADGTADRAVAFRRAGLLLDLGDFDGAEAAYGGLLARDAHDAAARAGLATVREAREASAMPEEYRRIPAASRLTRADLAALFATRVKALRRVGPGEPTVAVDIAGTWAREHIAAVLALDVMEVYPNHTFQPWATIRRVDLARAAARALDRLRWPRATAPSPSDMPRAHLDYDAVDRVLGAGVMALSPDGAFEPWRAVSGAEAIAVVDAVARLVGP